MTFFALNYTVSLPRARKVAKVFSQIIAGRLEGSVVWITWQPRDFCSIRCAFSFILCVRAFLIAYIKMVMAVVIFTGSHLQGAGEITVRLLLRAGENQLLLDCLLLLANDKPRGGSAKWR